MRPASADLEHEAGASVQVRIQVDREVVELAFLVPSYELVPDVGGVGLEEARSHVERFLVEDHPDFGGRTGRHAFGRLLRDESGGHRCQGPRVLVQNAIQIYDSFQGGRSNGGKDAPSLGARSSDGARSRFEVLPFVPLLRILGSRLPG